MPIDYNSMCKRFFNFEGLSIIIFGEESSLSSGLKKLQQLLKPIESLLTGMIETDPNLAAEICYAVDSRTQQFLEECTNAGDRSEVDDSIVDFKDIITSIKSRTFFTRLPPTFKSIMNGSDDDGVDPKRSPKKRKVNEGRKDDSVEQVKNADQIQEFKIRPGEDWRSVFCGNPGDRVSWNDKERMCPRWHSKGFCFPNCNNKSSHVPEDKVTEIKKKEYRGYLKKIRKE